MEISEKELKEFGVEVDMPIDWSKRPATQSTIKYEKETDSYVLADIKTGEVHYRYKRLSDLVRTTNQLYNYTDRAVE